MSQEQYPKTFGALSDTEEEVILFKASDTEKHGKLQKKDIETKYSSCLNIIQPSVHFQLFS